MLSGYPSFLRALTRPSAALLPAYTTPLLSLLDILPRPSPPPASSLEETQPLPLLPDALYAPHSEAHPLIAKYLHTHPSASVSSSDTTWRTCPSSDDIDSNSARVVPYVPQDISTPSEIVDPIRVRRNGSLLNLDRVLLHSPLFAQGWNSLFGELRGSNISIDAKHKELAICMVAILNEAEYEFYQHRLPWVSAGGTEEQTMAVRLLGGGNHTHFMQARRENTPLLSWSCFDDMEMDIIQLTIEMTKYVKTSPDLMLKLQESLGSNAALVEMTGVIAGYNMVSRFLVAMDITAVGEGDQQV